MEIWQAQRGQAESEQPFKKKFDPVPNHYSMNGNQSSILCQGSVSRCCTIKLFHPMKVVNVT